MDEKEKTKVYADTSVFGGILDDKFKSPSQLFFDQIIEGKFQLVVSDVISREIDEAPEPVRDLFTEMLVTAEIAEVTQKALELRQAYIDENILSPKWANDALHVALATIWHCEIIVSWNFKHIVHYQKIPLYNAVNTLKGYSNINIFSPLEVLDYGA